MIKHKLKQLWNRIKTINYKKGIKTTIQLLEPLPGILGWSVEALSLAGALIMIYTFIETISTQSAKPFTYLIAAATLIGVAILTDFYTQPKQEKQ